MMATSTHKSRKNSTHIYLTTILLIVVGTGVVFYTDYTVLAFLSSSSTETVSYAFADEQQAKYYQCLSKLPRWVEANSADLFSQEVIKGSKGLTDKTLGSSKKGGHRYHYMYHHHMSRIARTVCDESRGKNIRILEIGLGCHSTGGMINGKPGGSAFAWRYMFPAPAFDLDLHIMEYDEDCGKKWAEENPGVAHVHAGDASDPISLQQVVEKAGGGLFDIIIDDGSHINSHQITGLTELIDKIAPGGIYVVEDIHSSCKQWKANIGSDTNIKNLRVKGTRGCMKTIDGKQTIFDFLVEWQKKLIVGKEPIEGVKGIDLNLEAVAIEKL